MSDDARNQALEAARALEKRGETDAAVRGFLRVGAIEEAARALVGAKRFADAGHLVMQSLGVGPQMVGGLDAGGKKLAMKAAVCFAQAGEPRRAVELFLALGDPGRAAEVMDRAGDAVEAARIRARVEKKSGGGGTGTDIAGAAGRAAALRLEHAGQFPEALNAYMQLKSFADAARMAYKLRRFVDAAQLFEDAGMSFEAAACYAEGGETGRCLEAVVRVPKDHPKYRVAAAQAIRLGNDLGVLDFKLDHFIGPYVADGPKDERELEVFYVLGKLYRARDFSENAREVFRKILKVKPGYRDVQERFDALEAESKGSRMAYEQIVREDAAFHGDSRSRAAAQSTGGDDLFPDLPELPPPPAAPPPAPRTAYGAPPPSGGRIPVGPPRTMSTSGMVAPPRTLSRQMAAVVPPPPQPSSTTAQTEIGASNVPRATARSGSPPPPTTMPGELVVGATVADRYRIEAKIGQGGMAAVYRAFDIELGENIAIKLFLQPSDDPQLLTRFKQELTLSRSLAHPNIVRLYDIGQHQGCRFISMELLTGTDLGALIEGKPMDLARGLNYLIQACQGLALAHEKGVIHRDIKPANFFITTDDTLKVMDFGIAKKSSSGGGMTVAGFIAGTPAYMSPEQINNFAAVSYRTDLYALGVVAYELFTGSVPFDHDEMMQLLMMHLTKAPDPPSSRNEDIPPELEQIILQLLEKDPAKRIQSCRELGEILKELQPREPKGLRIVKKKAT